jgi:hypothetical protein
MLEDLIRFRHLNLSNPSARRETETRETWLLSIACKTAILLQQQISTTAKLLTQQIFNNSKDATG